MKSTLKETVVCAIQTKQGQEVTILDLRKITHAVADYFIICSGNKRQVGAIADEVIKATQQALGEGPWQQEGLRSQEWVLLDYGDVVVHIFQPEKRNDYALEALWGDANITHAQETMQYSLTTPVANAS